MSMTAIAKNKNNISYPWKSFSVQIIQQLELIFLNGDWSTRTTIEYELLGNHNFICIVIENFNILVIVSEVILVTIS